MEAIDQTDYQKLLEKYMTLIAFSNQGRTFVNGHQWHFRHHAGISDDDLAKLRLIDDVVPKAIPEIDEDDFGNDDPLHNQDLGYDDD